MKKVLSLILAVAMLASCVAMVSAANFPDVDSNYSWAEDAIGALSNDGIITGYDDGTFKPGKDITRQEAITLFSKALGASEEANKMFIDLAYGIYATDLAESDGSYAIKQGAYLIYKKVLTADDVNNYLSEDNRNITLKRFEAATLIAKALGADAWLKDNPEFEITFSDKDEIPTGYEGYIYYATGLGIMNGMGDNKFGPNETVTRAQIAVMIKRILDTMDFSYVNGMISDVDPVSNILTVKTAEGSKESYGISLTDVIFLDGTKVIIDDLTVGMECVVTFQGEKIYQVDAVTFNGEETVSGVFKGYQTSSSGTTIKIADNTQSTNPITTYTLASNAVIEFDGEPAALTDLATGNYVSVKISGGLVVTVSAEKKTQEMTSAKIQDIETSVNGVVLTLITKTGETVKYPLASSATIMRNSSVVTYDELAIGDTASLVLEYRQITSIKAIGKVTSATGTIVEITISNGTSYITIANGSKETKYAIARNCNITIEEEKSDIYDLRLNSYVTLKLSSETVTAISSEAVSQALTVSGVVKTINTSYGLVIITCQENGVTFEKQLFIGDSTKIINAQTGKSLTIKNIAVGNSVTAAGTEKLGVYEVASVMVFQ